MDNCFNYMKGFPFEMQIHMCLPEAIIKQVSQLKVA